LKKYFRAGSRGWMRRIFRGRLRAVKAQEKKRAQKNPLTLLGTASALPQQPSSGILETFPNSHPGRQYLVRLDTEDFSSVCPVTGQPDYAKIAIEYVPGTRCVETKSLKYYLASFRNTPSFNEQIVNRILDDLVATCEPVQMMVRGAFAARGGLSLTITATHEKKAGSVTS
jgi:7-cyano-7-deazaguanine reductase